MIVAHLDLDAFFAAVEELEHQSLRRVPLIVGGDPHGRGVVATCNYVARSFGDPLRDVGRRRRSAAAPTRCSSPAPLALPRLLTRGLVDSCARSCRPSSRRGSTRATSTWARSRPPSTTPARSPRRCRRSCGHEPGSRAHSGVATSKVVAKVASDRRKPGGLTVVRPGPRGGVPRALPDPDPAGRRAASRGAARQASGSRRSATSPRSPTTTCGTSCRARSVASCATGRAASTLGRSRCRPSASRSRRRRRSPATSPIPSGCTTSCGGCRSELAEHLRGRGQVARTVTTKVRYPDFAIRTRSTSLAVGTDDAATHRRARVRAPRPGAA